VQIVELVGTYLLHADDGRRELADRGDAYLATPSPLISSVPSARGTDVEGRDSQLFAPTLSLPPEE